MKKLSHLPDEILAVLKDVWWEGYDIGHKYGYVEAEWDDGCAHNLNDYPQRNSNPYAEAYKERRAERSQFLDKLLSELRQGAAAPFKPTQPHCHDGICFFCQTEVDEFGCDCTGTDSYA